MMSENKNIIIISDSTGKTAKRLMDAVLAQYASQKVIYSIVNIFQNIREEKQLHDILEKIDNDYLVIFSLISQELQKKFEKMLKERGFLYLNVLEPMLSILSKFLGVHPDYKPGLLQVVDDKYYKKIDAIGYTVEHDDGRGVNVKEADIILLGLSRTCKTPISMYLSCNYGLKVANIPIIPHPDLNQQLLRRLNGYPLERIFGLMMDPDVLIHVREERSVVITGGREHPTIHSYFDPNLVREEIKFCRQLFNENNWGIIDVTKRAIEEISTEILERLKIES
ncbi:MAG: kinase/pyrophosphorylase [candidate division Zixibacteria bacterium]|nr:kinase/pyrophosphorylase [candidate division Zixibacteria bacterium]MDD5427597.1 kinase/pyrophosphorylase [candidate division Zixibacteria bacterium]